MLNHEFIDQITKEHRAGFGFVPFVGSGLSVASGIITAQTFDSFLAHTVRLCCAKRWNLRSNGWPPHPTRDESIETRKWIGAQVAKLCQNISVSNKPFSIEGISFAKVMSEMFSGSQEEASSLRRFLTLLERAVSSQEHAHTQTWTTASELNERAVLSLRDWRATLVFLASLRYDSDAKRNVLTAMEPSVIDSFSTHITRGRRRNLAHSMLCHLASRMRMRTILTTNFDTLIEDAFAELGEPLRVLRVSNKGTLPSAETVHSMNCCVKLHGELHETRADFTLNDPPGDRDLSTFFHYIKGRPRSERWSAVLPGTAVSEGKDFLPSHLLVCGYSGSDERCMRMIEYVLDCADETKVFWICHTRESMEWLLNESRLREATGQFFVTQTDRTDLLLYQLYQHVTLSLPKGGFNYQFNHNYPPTLWQDSGQDKDNYSSPTPNPFDEFPKAYCVTGANRGLERMSQLFCDALAVNKECIWLELEDYSDVFGVAQELFQIISLRSGNYEIEYTSFIPRKLAMERRSRKTSELETKRQWQERLDRVMASWRLLPKDYVIFVYGRNGPGGRRGWAEDWDGTEHYWKQGHLNEFRILLNALVECGFSVVYAPYNAERREAERTLYNKVKSEGLLDEISARRLFPGATFSGGDLKKGIFEDNETWGEKIQLKAVRSKWIRRIARLNAEIERLDEEGRHKKENESWRFRRFLFDASLFRQSRHYSALISEAMIACPSRFNHAFIDNDVERSHITEKWLNEPWLIPLLRAKRGGYLWLYRDTRMAFRILSADRRPRAPRQKRDPVRPRKLLTNKLSQKLSKAHFSIGDWYQSAFCATGHAEPLLEALYHFWQAALHAHDEDHSSRVKEAHLSRQEYVFRRCRISIFSWIKLMRLGRDSIRFWTNEYEAEAWFDFTTGRAKDAFTELEECLYHNERNAAKATRRQRKESQYWMAMMREEAERHVEPFSDLSEDFVRQSEWTRGSSSALDGEYGQCFGEIVDCWKRKGRWYKPWQAILKPGAFAGVSKIFEIHDTNMAFSGRATDQKTKEILSMVLKEAERYESPFLLYTLVQHLFELTYSQVRRSKLKERRLIESPGQATYLGRFGTEWNERLQGDDILEEWVKVCVLSRIMLDLCTHIHPNLWESDFRMRVAILGTYGLALGKLGRFHEAHRRLNEAHAIRSKVSARGAARDFGIIKLRRAELHLLEANFLADLFKFGWQAGAIKNPETKKHLEKRYHLTFSDALTSEDACKLYRMHLAKLDDAWLSLEGAEHWLKGHSHSSLWWGRLIALQMRVFADRLDITPETHQKASWYKQWAESFQNIRGIAFRAPRDRLDYLRGLFRKGESCLAGKPYQILRLVHYYVVAENKLSAESKHSSAAYRGAKNTIDEFRHLKAEVCAWLLKQYAGVVKDDLDRKYFDNLKPRIGEIVKEKSAGESDFA